MASEEENQICIVSMNAMLAEAQSLMRDIEKLLEECKSAGAARQRRSIKEIEQDCQDLIQEDGEALIIDGFRFESAATKEGVMRLSAQRGAGGGQGSA